MSFLNQSESSNYNRVPKRIPQIHSTHMTTMSKIMNNDYRNTENLQTLRLDTSERIKMHQCPNLLWFTGSRKKEMRGNTGSKMERLFSHFKVLNLFVFYFLFISYVGVCLWVAAAVWVFYLCIKMWLNVRVNRYMLMSHWVIKEAVMNHQLSRLD